MNRAWILRLTSVVDELRHGFLFLPIVAVLTATGAAIATLRLDERLGDLDPPVLLGGSAENARTLLSTLAGGTITAASIVFSLTLLAVQLAASQYSPRALHGLIGDRFQQLVIGVVLGTFSFCVVALSGIDPPEGADGSYVPRLTITLALLLGLASLLAVIGSIHRTATGLRVASVADGVTRQTIAVVRRHLGDDAAEMARESDRDVREVFPHAPPNEAVALVADDRGWVQQIGVGAMLDALPEGSVAWVQRSVGEYVQEGEPILVVSPAPEDVEGVRRRLRRSIVVGNHRTLQQDVAFGLIQLSDIGLRALSPGVNDPRTAMEVIPRICEVLTEIAVAGDRVRVVERAGVTVVLAHGMDLSDFVALGIAPLRRAAQDDQDVLECIEISIRRAAEQALRRRSDADVSALTG